MAASQHPQWAPLSATARLVLSFMCRYALDTRNAAGAEPGIYFGGHEQLVFHLTGAVPGDPHYGAGVRRVERAVSDLRKAGAVHLDTPARPGRRAVYRMRVHDLLTIQDER